MNNETRLENSLEMAEPLPADQYWEFAVRAMARAKEKLWEKIESEGGTGNE